MEKPVRLTVSIFMAIVGAVLASFTITVVDRIQSHQSIVRPGSHCFACGHRLGPVDLIPIFSYLWLRGRCHYCRAPIPWRIFLIELAGGVVGFIIPWVIL